MKTLFTFSFLLIFGIYLSGQCTNTIQWPSSTVSVSSFNDTVIIATDSYAGDFSEIDMLEGGQTYVFSSSNSGDYITLRNPYDPSILIAHGETPLTYSSASVDILAAHYNLSPLSCGTNFLTRTVSVQCTTCPDVPPVVGVNTTQPNATLDVEGEIKIGDTGRSPESGMIRWNETSEDFEGYNGEKWVSLTTSSETNQWGKIPSNKMAPDEKIVNSSGNANDNAGFSVSISGDYAVVGSPGSEVGANAAQGEVYIFHKSNSSWILESTLIADDGISDDRFGSSVAIDGDYIVVGSPRTFEFSSSPGAAYVYHRTGENWIQQSKLTASDGALENRFGECVAISGDYCVIGAYRTSVGSVFLAGAAYVYNRVGAIWTQQSKLVASDGEFTDHFGISVCIEGNYIGVGALNHDVGSNTNQGAAYIFTRLGSTWSQQNKLVASDGESNDKFGCAISISGNRLICSTNDNTQGTVYVFQRTGSVWNENDKIEANDGGFSISISGDYIIIGSSNHDVNSKVNQGTAYIFFYNNSSWELLSKFCANDGQENDNFGYSVDISSDSAIIGSYNDDIGINENQGSAYIITKK